ncbi:unnamed protein product [Ceutorhynchus assimilis]|uniref:Uncharacterized protein n=1 Tax=Ceutorhynchus assimilis TaxID=467358 RepID=A0A9N9MNZ1_9CUCU|nr:unnamed protein product [Ceutorhynchus assimilis]
MNKCLVLLIFLFLHNFVSPNTNIKIYKIIRCNDQTYYPVTIKDVSLEIQNGYVNVSGSLTTDSNITGPVQAALTVKRYIDYIDIWTIIPCFDNIGSCTYNDLCYWGKPQNETCPQRFLENNVPCSRAGQSPQ